MWLVLLNLLSAFGNVPMINTCLLPNLGANLCRSGEYTLSANRTPTARHDESHDDITAAETAPRPITAIGVGVRYLSTNGSTSG